MNFNSKKIVKTIIILILVILVLFGGSYAWLNNQVTSGNTNVLRAGNLSLILDEENTNGIELMNAQPLTNETGMEQERYFFQLKNEGKTRLRYTIYLDDVELEEDQIRMDDKVLKYSLKKNDEEQDIIYLNEIGKNPKRIVDSGLIEENTTNDYLMKLWMSEEKTSEYEETIFYGKLRVEVEQEGNVVAKAPGTTTIETQDKTTGEKKKITLKITKTLNALYMSENNGLLSITSEKESCKLDTKGQTNCSVSLLSVEVEEGYEFIGWNTDSTSHEGEITSKSISSDTIYYPIIKKKAITYKTSLLNELAGVSSLGSTVSSCTVSGTAPTITASSGYTVAGWYTSSSYTSFMFNSGASFSKSISANTTYYAYAVKTITNYGYTGGVQSFTVPVAGKYKLETWGASGGYAYDSSRKTGGGGGATHIAFRTGVLLSLSSYKSDVIIVSGGGGGGDYYPDWGGLSTGGTGGGWYGGISSHQHSIGAGGSGYI